MLPVLSALSKFFIVKIHAFVDIYPIFCFKPLQYLSHSVGKMLKKHIISSLSDKSRLTSALRSFDSNIMPLSISIELLFQLLLRFYKCAKRDHRDMICRLISLI